MMMAWAFVCCAFPLTVSAQAASEETLYPRKMVIEKGTGTWCPNCPIGIVGVGKMAERYPDTVIPIDIHYGNDPMYCEAYRNFGIFSMPGAQINRKPYMNGTEKEYVVYPTFESLHSFYATSTAPVHAKVETTIVPKDGMSYILETYTTLGFSTTTANYRIAYVILEDKVGPYNQVNAFAGSGASVGGWENYGSVVSYVYNNVARTVLPNLRGMGNNIPTTMTRDVPHKKNLRIEPAQYVDNLENAKVVTLLLHGETGEIINADIARFAGVTAVDSPLMETKAEAETEVYDLYGRRLAQPQKGLNIIGGKKVMR